MPTTPTTNLYDLSTELAANWHDGKRSKVLDAIQAQPDALSGATLALLIAAELERSHQYASGAVALKGRLLARYALSQPTPTERIRS